MRARRWCALPLLICACGGSQEDEKEQTSWRVPRAVTQISFERGPAADVLEDRVLWRATGSADGWRVVQAESSEVVEEGLRIFGTLPTEVHVDCPSGLTGVNAIALEVDGLEGTFLRAGVRAGGGVEPRLMEAPALGRAFVGPGERARILFDLRKLAAHESPAEFILRAVAKEDVHYVVRAVELLRRDPSSFLPRSGEAPTLIERDGDARPAWGLTAEHALCTRLPGGADGRLAFSCCVAPSSPDPGPGARLRIEVGGVLLHEESLAAFGESWRHVWVDLPPGEAERTLAFSLVGEVRASAAMTIAEPRAYPLEDDPPSVLLVTSDTHRGDHLGSAPGAVAVSTPALDALARAGVRFERCLASSNNTLPSHAVLMTGLSPKDTSVTNNRMRLGARATTLAERFHAAGYVTLAVTSAKHMNDDWSGLGQGFDRIAWPAHGNERRAADSLAVLAEWLRDVEGAPVFLWVHLFDAHRPYDPPGEHAHEHYPSGGDPFDESLPEPDFPPPPKLKGLRDRAWVDALYRGEIAYVDRQLAPLLDDARFAHGIIAVTADHGESLGEQGIWWEHIGLYPAVLHVPLILRWPGAPAGTSVRGTVQHADLTRTLLELAGLDASDLPGVDLRAHLAGAARETAAFAVGSDQHALAVTVGRWHLVVNLRTIGNARMHTLDLPRDHPVQLFDLDADPTCARDLAPDEPGRTAQLGRMLLDWAEAPGAGLAQANEVDAGASAMLESLGYASGDSSGDGSRVADLDELRAALAPFLD